VAEPEGGKPTSDERALRDQLVMAGTEAAKQWLTTRANRRMSEVNRKRLAGHVVNALWQQIEQATVEIAGWIAEDDRAALAAATARAEQAEARVRALTELVADVGRDHDAAVARADTAEARAEEDTAVARAEAVELRIRLQAAEATLENQEQQLREDIAAALYKRSADLVIEAGRHHDDIMAAIISAEAQGFSNAALFIRDRTEQVPDDE
jgi:hypothetical protein